MKRLLMLGGALALLGAAPAWAQAPSPGGGGQPGPGPQASPQPGQMQGEGGGIRHFGPHGGRVLLIPVPAGPQGGPGGGQQGPGEMAAAPGGPGSGQEGPGGPQGGPEGGPHPGMMGPHGMMGMRMMEGHGMEGHGMEGHHRPPPSKAAAFRFTKGSDTIEIKCADDESTQACVQASIELLNRVDQMGGKQSGQ